MEKEKVIAIFDIGKTNKKFLLFNLQLEIIYSHEKSFPLIKDDDGFDCDDIKSVESWMEELLYTTLEEAKYNVLAINFSCYGSTMVYVDKKGRVVAPVYNYLKQMPPDVQEKLYQEFGGKDEFCRITASPQLGNENCGHNILWLKKYKPHFFEKTKWALFLAQYFSFSIHQKPIAELTSIGCHTGLWNHDENNLHEWTKSYSIDHLIPKIEKTTKFIEVEIKEKRVKVGIGMHDSSASIAPYLFKCKEPFILISTGTWCININSFNQTKLSSYELEKGCLNYISVLQKPVKASKIILGHIHNVNVQRLSELFKVNKDFYKDLCPNVEILRRLLVNGEMKPLFFGRLPVENYISYFNADKHFNTAEEAYHQLLFELVMMNYELLELIIDDEKDIKEVYISGGFAKNKLFVKLIATLLPQKRVFVSKIKNASALGAAIITTTALNKLHPEDFVLEKILISPLNLHIDKNILKEQNHV